MKTNKETLAELKQVLRHVEKWKEAVEKDLDLAEAAATEAGKGVDFGLWIGRAQILRAEAGRIEDIRRQLEKIIFAFECKES